MVRLWIPSTGEERFLNILALVLALLLLALGFEILKLPAAVVPSASRLIRVLGLVALVCLGFVISWMNARDDFIRRKVGLPRVAFTYLLLSFMFSLAFLLRGALSRQITLDVAATIDISQLLVVGAGGQFATMAFIAAFYFKKTDTGKVREFKISETAIKAFARAARSKRLTAAQFDDDFRSVESEMKGLPDVAKALRAAVSKDEFSYASRYAATSASLAGQLSSAPTYTEAVDVLKRNSASVDFLAAR